MVLVAPVPVAAPAPVAAEAEAVMVLPPTTTMPLHPRLTTTPETVAAGESGLSVVEPSARPLLTPGTHVYFEISIADEAVTVDEAGRQERQHDGTQP